MLTECLEFLKNHCKCPQALFVQTPWKHLEEIFCSFFAVTTVVWLDKTDVEKEVQARWQEKLQLEVT